MLLNRDMKSLNDTSCSPGLLVLLALRDRPPSRADARRLDETSARGGVLRMTTSVVFGDGDALSFREGLGELVLTLLVP